MSFLFVDRILEIETCKRARGIKHVTAEDPYLKRGKNGDPVLFSCIIGETLGQLTAWMVMQANQFSKRPVAGIIHEVRIWDEACVGDTLVLETEIETLNDEAVLYNSFASIGNKKIFEIVHSMGPMLPMEDFIDTGEAKAQFEAIYRPGSLPGNGLEQPVSFKMPTKPAFNDTISFDQILTWEKGHHLIAKKNVSLMAPYFSDHFPRKPVLPLTLLLESKIELAAFFLTDLLGSLASIALTTIRKTKMKQFVLPGDQIITTLDLKASTDHAWVLGFKSQVEGKTVCVTEAVFERKV